MTRVIFLATMIFFLSLSVALSQKVISYNELSTRYDASVTGMKDPITGHMIFYYYGGLKMIPFTKITYYKDLIKHDQETGELTIIENATGDLPPKMDGHHSTIIDNKIYIYGGEKRDDNDEPIYNEFNTVYIYDIIANSWTKSTMSEFINRKNMTAVEDGNKVHLIGGRDEENNLSNKYQILDLSTQNVETKSAIMTGGNQGAAAMINDNKLFLIGGQTLSGISGNILVYDMINNFWSMTGIAGQFAPSVNALIGKILGDSKTLYLWGGLSSGSGKKVMKTEANEYEISTKLYKIYIDTESNQIVSELIKDNMPQIMGGTSWVDINDGDTIIYAIGGISNISITGDTTFNSNYYRYKISSSKIELYDTTNHVWSDNVSVIDDNNNILNEELAIYPNPSDNNIFISIFDKQAQSISILNSLGIEIKRIIGNDLLGKGTISLSTDDFPSGIYYCTIKSKGKQLTKRFLIIK